MNEGTAFKWYPSRKKRPRATKLGMFVREKTSMKLKLLSQRDASIVAAKNSMGGLTPHVCGRFLIIGFAFDGYFFLTRHC